MSPYCKPSSSIMIRDVVSASASELASVMFPKISETSKAALRMYILGEGTLIPIQWLESNRGELETNPLTFVTIAAEDLE